MPSPLPLPPPPPSPPLSPPLLCRGLLRRPRLAELFTITPPASTANWGVMEPDGTDAPCAPFAGERCFATACCRTSTSVLTSQSGYSATLG